MKQLRGLDGSFYVHEGDVVVCTFTEYPGYYKVGEMFNVINRGHTTLVKQNEPNGVNYGGTYGTWAKVGSESLEDLL